MMENGDIPEIDLAEYEKPSPEGANHSNPTPTPYLPSSALLCSPLIITPSNPPFGRSVDPMTLDPMGV